MFKWTRKKCPQFSACSLQAVSRRYNSLFSPVSSERERDFRKAGNSASFAYFVSSDFASFLASGALGGKKKSQALFLALFLVLGTTHGRVATPIRYQRTLSVELSSKNDSFLTERAPSAKDSRRVPRIQSENLRSCWKIWATFGRWAKIILPKKCRALVW